MLVVMCPNCDHRMNYEMSEDEMMVFRCPNCGKGLLTVPKRYNRVKRSSIMKELGIEMYRLVEGGDLEEGDDEET